MNTQQHKVNWGTSIPEQSLKAEQCAKCSQSVTSKWIQVWVYVCDNGPVQRKDMLHYRRFVCQWLKGQNIVFQVYPKHEKQQHWPAKFQTEKQAWRMCNDSITLAGNISPIQNMFNFPPVAMAMNTVWAISTKNRSSSLSWKDAQTAHRWYLLGTPILSYSLPNMTDITAPILTFQSSKGHEMSV